MADDGGLFFAFAFIILLIWLSRLRDQMNDSWIYDEEDDWYEDFEGWELVEPIELTQDNQVKIDEEELVLFCPECDFKSESMWKYCPMCGTRIVNEKNQAYGYFTKYDKNTDEEDDLYEELHIIELTEIEEL